MVDQHNRKENKSLSEARFSQFAENYVTSQSHARGYDLDRLIEIAQPRADWLVLDVATGGGHTALKFAPYVARVIASDLTPKMLVAAQKYIHGQGVRNVVFEPADAENLPFDEGLFDLVTCRIAPHHFPDVAGFIEEGHRVLKSGGLLLLQDHVLPDDVHTARFIDNFERLRDPSHNRAYSQREWVLMFEQAGLQVEHAEQIIKRHQLIPWAERQACSAEAIGQLKQILRDAPTLAAAWLQAEDIESPQISFVNHHILIAGRKKAR